MLKDRDELKEYNHIYHKTHYDKNKESEKQRIKLRKTELYEWLVEYKSTHPCEMCGESHPACLDFHHIDPGTKDREVSTGVADGWGKKRILEEIAKCKVLCSNCHRKLHWNQISRS